MDGLASDAFERALLELADHHDITGPARAVLSDLVSSIFPDRPRPSIPGDDSRKGSDVDDTVVPPVHHSDDTTTFFPSVPTRRTEPNQPNPFRRRRFRSSTSFSRPVDRRKKLDRFINLGLIGRGGMGEVYRVLDPKLDRRMVLKVLRHDRVGHPPSTARFMEEARLTSQLDHPGIVPVHEMGELDDGRLYFAMREVRGRTLSEVIDDYHSAFDDHDSDERSWTSHFHGLIDIFIRICEPVAYAHSQDIIHRDLKPSNIMVGDFGEVQILDWGLAKPVADPDDDSSTTDRSNTGVDSSEQFEFQRSDSPFDTRRGSIVGTPAFMPPEQARGALDDLGPASDVYSLGAILFMVLDGQMPFEGPTAANILFQVVAGIDRRPGPDHGTPKMLADICLQAMETDRSLRFEDAAAFAERIDAWRAGFTRRKKAFALIDEADELIPQIDELRRRAENLHEMSRRKLREIPRSAPIDEKRRTWNLAEEAQLLEREANAHRARAIQHLNAALAHVPDLDEAHDRLAAIYRRDHEQAEERRDTDRANSLEFFIRAHNTGAFDDYLEGNGRLTIRTDPPGARVELYRYVRRDRRLVPAMKRFFGYTPIVDVELSMGSYLLIIEADDHLPVRYPVFVGRQQTWSGAPPNADEPFRIPLPRGLQRADDDLFVPASPFWRGGDERAENSPPRSIKWLDSFVIKETPVTHAQYLDFLNDLIASGRIEEAERHCPRNAGNIGYGQGNIIYQRQPDGRFAAREPTDDFLDQPVSLINWHSARAYARWFSDRTGQPWRLPTSDEWEKAARGVDGRFYPWGDFLDPTWCRMLYSSRDAPCPVTVDSYPDDESPYGMRGAAGNIREWCLPDGVENLDDIDDEQVVPFRGGCWFSTAEMCRLASRSYKPPSTRSAGNGFRLARDDRG